MGVEKKQELKKSITTPTATPIATPTLEKNVKVKTTAEIQAKPKIEKINPKITAKSVEFQRAKTADAKKVTNKSFVATIRTNKNK